MKKFLGLLVVLFICSQLSFAQYGGFSGTSSAKSITVSEVKTARDGDYVSLFGTIQSKIGDEKYLFIDKTGEITVEIDDRDWNGLTVKSTDNVIIEGEVDKDFRSIKIEVDTIRLSK